MRKWAVILSILFMAGSLHAGTIIVSGDSNIGNSIDGSFGAPAADNAVFFQNILGGGNKVLLQFGASGGSIGDAENAMFNLYAGMAGVSASQISTPVTAVDLAGVNLFISVVPLAAYSSSELSLMSTFLAGNRTLFFIGENSSFFATNNAFLNSALASLGSTMSLHNAAVDCGDFRDAIVASDPFNAGVTTFTYSCTSEITGGTTLYSDVSNHASFVSYETPVPEPASLLMLATGLSLAGRAIRRKLCS